MRTEQEDVGFRIKQISEEIQRHGNNHLRCCGLTMTQFHVLCFLHHQPNKRSTQKAIEEKLGVSHPTVAGILKRLESKELVRTTVNEKDHRRNDVALTQAGNDYVTRFRADRLLMEQTLTRNMTETECRELIRLLDRLCENVRAITDAKDSQEEGVQHG